MKLTNELIERAKKVEEVSRFPRGVKMDGVPYSFLLANLFDPLFFSIASKALSGSERASLLDANGSLEGRNGANHWLWQILIACGVARIK